MTIVLGRRLLVVAEKEADIGRFAGVVDKITAQSWCSWAKNIAEPIGLLDCCGVSDGAACAIVTTPEIARELAKSSNLVTAKALQLSTSSGEESGYAEWDGSYVATTRLSAQRPIFPLFFVT